MIQYLSLALSAVQAISSMNQGKDQQKDNEYNAKLLGYKAAVVDVKKDIEFAQYQRLMNETWATSMANTASMGITATGGSAMAVMMRTQRAIAIDQTIGQFNLEQEKRYIMGEADAELRAGTLAKKAGRVNAFSKILNGVSNYAMYSKGVTAK